MSTTKLSRAHPAYLVKRSSYLWSENPSRYNQRSSRAMRNVQMLGPTVPEQKRSYPALFQSPVNNGTRRSSQSSHCHNKQKNQFQACCAPVQQHAATNQRIPESYVNLAAASEAQASSQHEQYHRNSRDLWDTSTWLIFFQSLTQRVLTVLGKLSRAFVKRYDSARQNSFAIYTCT